MADFPGTIFGNLFPLAWYHNFNGSRVFYTSLGHKNAYYADPDFRKHLEGGVRYVLGSDEGKEAELSDRSPDQSR